MTTIDQTLSEKLCNWYIGEWPVGNLIACAIALFLSIILCGAIGIEREKRGRTAGLRTHLLVGVGSCLIMIISIYGFPSTETSRDVARLAAQVIAGVGFLGAGAIMHRNSGIKGLTTAATIWIVMAIGLACGSFNYILATGSTLLILIVLIVFRKFETRINKKSILASMKVSKNSPAMEKALSYAREFDYSINDIQTEVDEDLSITFTFLITSNNGEEVEANVFFEKLENVEGVLELKVLNSHH